MEKVYYLPNIQERMQRLVHNSGVLEADMQDAVTLEAQGHQVAKPVMAAIYYLPQREEPENLIA